MGAPPGFPVPRRTGPGTVSVLKRNIPPGPPPAVSPEFHGGGCRGGGLGAGAFVEA